MLFHSCSIYDLNMNNLANSCGEDLFNLISGMDRVIVDNGAEWKQQSLKEPNKAFILGRTVSSEKHNLEGEFFNKKVKGGRKNVFLFAVKSINGLPIFRIHRLDSHFKSTISKPLPTFSEMTPAEEAQWNDPVKRLQLRDDIAETVTNFPSDLLQAKIKESVSPAFKNYQLSYRVAGWAYALLLQGISSKENKEWQKFLNNDKNLFGDTALIQEALFFRAGVLSKNSQHLRPMTSYCEIKFEEQPQ